ncbi:hypothetical protein MHYP_G00015890 [Metynnis hypsauchen]
MERGLGRQPSAAHSQVEQVKYEKQDGRQHSFTCRLWLMTSCGTVSSLPAMSAHQLLCSSSLCFHAEAIDGFIFVDTAIVPHHATSVIKSRWAIFLL